MTVRAYLYDAGGRDRETALDDIDLAGLDETHLLWIDIDHRDPADTGRVADFLRIDPDRFREPQAGHEGRLDNYGDHYRFVVDSAPQHGQAEPNGKAEPGAGSEAKATRVDFVVGKSWLVTVHEGPVVSLDRFRDQDKAETMIGLLSSQALTASLLDWHLAGFFEEVSRIESAVDRLDERVLRETVRRGLLGRMVAMRRRVTHLRVLLVRQRDIFYGLSRPDFALVTEAGATPFFEALASRFERALDEVERARDLVTGSFELFTSRNSEQTNDLVKALTFLTAIIGFCAAVAGLMGMNFQLAFFQTGMTGFLAVTGGLVAVAIASVIWARMRRWI